MRKVIKSLGSKSAVIIFILVLGAWPVGGLAKTSHARRRHDPVAYAKPSKGDTQIKAADKQTRAKDKGTGSKDNGEIRGGSKSLSIANDRNSYHLICPV